LIVVLCVLAISCSVAVVSAYKQRKVHQLHAIAKQARGFTANPVALERLAEETHPIVDRLILEIAQDTETNPTIRIAAVKQLGIRRAKVGAAIADLLRPQESLELREAVVDGLKEMECLEDCIRRVLHYKERLFYGEPTAEGMLASLTAPTVRKSLDIDAKRVDAQLTDKLRSSSSTTTHVLVIVYGLGGAQPSKFSISVSQLLAPSDACPLLLRSSQERREIIDSDEDSLVTFIDDAVNRHCTGSIRGSNRVGVPLVGSSLEGARVAVHIDAANLGAEWRTAQRPAGFLLHLAGAFTITRRSDS
jgi:hypothetical protein